MRLDPVLRSALLFVSAIGIVGMIALGLSKKSESPAAQSSEARPNAEVNYPASETNALAVVSPLPINPKSPSSEIYQVPQREKLASFQKIKDKVFTSPDEDRDRKDMLRDKALIADMSAFLLDRRRFAKAGDSVAAQMERDQDSAVDFLLEALKEGDRESARAAILDVVKDSQVENGEIPLEQREGLAGVKGELLFHGTATAPQAFRDIASILPGPVSQKIWINVQTKQNENQQESLLEKQAHEKKYGGL